MSVSQLNETQTGKSGPHRRTFAGRDCATGCEKTDKTAQTESSERHYARSSAVTFHGLRCRVTLAGVLPRRLRCGT